MAARSTTWPKRRHENKMPVRMLPQPAERKRTRGRDLKPRKRRRCIAKPLEHGTQHGYAKHGCRCGACKTANTRRRKELNDQRPGIPKHLHGRPSTYFYMACRCLKCCLAACEYRKRYTLCLKCRTSVGTEDKRKKYCSEECRIAANVPRRRKTWRESKRKHNSLDSIRHTD